MIKKILIIFLFLTNYMVAQTDSTYPFTKYDAMQKYSDSLGLKYYLDDKQTKHIYNDYSLCFTSSRGKTLLFNLQSDTLKITGDMPYDEGAERFLKFLIHYSNGVYKQMQNTIDSLRKELTTYKSCCRKIPLKKIPFGGKWLFIEEDTK